MCRILALTADEAFDAADWLRAFALRCRESREYQGHGWGVAWWADGGWQRYRSLTPIWEDDLPAELRSTLVLVHARSAFRDEGIVLGNNMPFLADDLAFAFNGELRGVRLAAPGATGAVRLTHLLGRFRRAADGDVFEALRRLDAVVSARSDYVRALNVVVSDGSTVWVNAHWSEDPDYFTLHRTSVALPEGGALQAVSSEPFALDDGAPRWEAIANRTTRALGGVAAC